MMNPLRDRRGFGPHPPDLMIVFSIIAILLAIAIPKFAEVMRKSREFACRRDLAVIRAALAAHYWAANGRFPYHPAALTAGGRFLPELPRAETPVYHPDSAVVRLGLSSADSDDSGGWLYVGAPGAPQRGAVFVNCTHTDGKGTAWTSY